MELDGMSLHEQQLKVLEGIEYLAILARDRLNAALGELNDGDFDAAFDRAQEAIDKLRPLAFAQNGVASFAKGKRIVRAEDLREGMVVIGRGTVESIEERDHPGMDGQCYNVVLEGDTADLHVHHGAELLVGVEDDG